MDHMGEALSLVLCSKLQKQSYYWIITDGAKIPGSQGERREVAQGC
jgi:hypothetical protein